MKTTSAATFALGLMANAVAADDGNLAMSQFLGFARQYRKVYSGEAEFNKRFEVFKASLAAIEERNAVGEAQHGITKFSDLTQAEFDAQFLNSKPNPGTNATRTVTRRFAPLAGAPASIDWAAKGATTRVKNQGQCGSCWAFSAVAQIESDNFLKTGKLLTLSEQQVTSCDSTSYGCEGGWTEHAFDYVVKAGGVQPASTYPYVSGATTDTGVCKAKAADNAVKIAGYSHISTRSNTESNMGSAIGSGPMSVCVDASVWNSYKSGILGRSCGRRTNHCVQATGINTDSSGNTYWIVRNSWDTDWGVKGFVFIEYGVNGCEIATDATVANIA